MKKYLAVLFLLFTNLVFTQNNDIWMIANPVNFTVGSCPWGVVAGDLDGDSKPDVVASNSCSGTLTVFRNTSSPGIANSSSLTFATTLSPGGYTAVICDIDGDGKNDICSALGYVIIFRNTSSGVGNISFSAPLILNNATNGRGIYYGDLDGDGKTDIAVTEQSSNTVLVYRNASTAGNISFAAPIVLNVTNFANSIRIADFDADGKPDIVVSNEFSNTISTFRNTSTIGNITFGAKVDFAVNGAYCRDIEIGDINNDGKTDVLGVASVSNIFYVLKNNSTTGNINFGTPTVNYAVDIDPNGITIGDFNNDGLPDVAVGNFGSKSLKIFKNTSVGGIVSFALNNLYAYPNNVNDLSCADIDGDGKLDILSAIETGNVISYYRNATITPGILFSPPNSSVNIPVNVQTIWQKIYDATNYRIQIATDSAFSNIILDDQSLTDTTRIISGLNNNTTYYWHINGRNSNQTGNYSSVWNFTTIPPIPQPPALISPSNNAVNQPLALNLVWTKPAYALSYRVQLATDAGFTNIILNDSTLTDSLKSVTGLNNNTTYYWRVNAKNIAGTSTYSVVWNFTTILPIPQPPALISPVNNAINQPLALNLVWSKPPFATNYRVQLATDTGFTNLIINDSTLTDSVKAVSGLSNLTSYWWRVNAKNITGTSTYSAVFKFATIVSVPNAPVLFSPLNNQTGLAQSIILVWNKQPTATNYRVQAATDSLFNDLVLNDSTLTDSTRSLAGLSPYTNYWWRVNAKNIGGTSPYSPVWKFRTLGYPLQVIPVSPPDSSVNQPVNITFLWMLANEQQNKSIKIVSPENSVLSILNYWFELGTDTAVAPIVRDSTLTDTTKTVTGLTHLTEYYWRVKAKNQIGWGGFSKWYRFRTIIQNPTVPLQFSPQNNAINILLNTQLVWYRLPTAVNYHVQLSKDTSFSVLSVNDSTITDSVKTLTGLDTSTVYYWRVRAKNTGGYSAWSERWRFTTVPPPPAIPNLTAPPNGSTGLSLTPTLDWDSLTTAAGYQVQLCKDSLFNATVFDTTNVSTAYMVVPAGVLHNDTTYFWRVRAFNSGGNSGWSVIWNFRVSPIGITQTAHIIPKEYKLFNNYPNPFNPVTQIKFDVPKSSYVKIRIYDVLGREVSLIVNKHLEAGEYTISWDAVNYASGIYIYRMESQNFVDIKKMVLIK